MEPLPLTRTNEHNPRLNFVQGQGIRANDKRLGNWHEMFRPVLNKYKRQKDLQC